MPAYHTNPDMSIRDFTEAEVSAMEFETTDIEHGGFPTHTCGPDGTTTKATYFCKYDQYEAFKAYMVGATKAFTDGSLNKRISRLTPVL